MTIITFGYFLSLQAASLSSLEHSCKSGRAFRAGFGLGPGSGLTLRKTSGLFRGGYEGLQINFLIA